MQCCCACCVTAPPHTQSDLVKVFVGPGGAEPHEVSRISSVGTKAHGLVAWGHRDLLMLDSDYGALVSVDVATGNMYDLYVVRLKIGFRLGFYGFRFAGGRGDAGTAAFLEA